MPENNYIIQKYYFLVGGSEMEIIFFEEELQWVTWRCRQKLMSNNGRHVKPRKHMQIAIKHINIQQGSLVGLPAKHVVSLSEARL